MLILDESVSARNFVDVRRVLVLISQFEQLYGNGRRRGAAAVHENVRRLLHGGIWKRQTETVQSQSGGADRSAEGRAAFGGDGAR